MDDQQSAMGAWKIVKETAFHSPMQHYILLQRKSVDEDLKWICHIEMVENVSQVLPDGSLQALYFYHPETLLCLHTSISNGKIPDAHGLPILKTPHHVRDNDMLDK